MGQTVACNACGCELDSTSASRHGPRFFCSECAQLILGSEDAAPAAAPRPAASVSRVVPVPKAQSSVSKASKPIARSAPPIIENDPEQIVIEEVPAEDVQVDNEAHDAAAETQPRLSGTSKKLGGKPSSRTSGRSSSRTSGRGRDRDREERSSRPRSRERPERDDKSKRPSSRRRAEPESRVSSRKSEERGAKSGVASTSSRSSRRSGRQESGRSEARSERSGRTKKEPDERDGRSTRRGSKNGEDDKILGLSKGLAAGIAGGVVLLVVLAVLAIGGGGEGRSKPAQVDEGGDKDPSGVWAQRAEKRLASGDKTGAVSAYEKAAAAAEREGNLTQQRRYSMQQMNLIKGSKRSDR